MAGRRSGALFLERADKIFLPARPRHACDCANGMIYIISGTIEVETEPGKVTEIRIILRARLRQLDFLLTLAARRSRIAIDSRMSAVFCGVARHAQVADQRRQDARQFVLPKRDRSAQTHCNQAEPRHALRGIQGLGGARRYAFGDSASYVLHQRHARKIHNTELSRFDQESSQQVGRGERGWAVAVIGGNLAHHPNAAGNKEQNIDKCRRTNGDYAESAGAGPTHD